MRRHLPLAYLVAALELLAGSFLIWGAWAVGQGVSREAHPQPADLVALAAMAVAGAGVAVAGAVTLFHSCLAYGTLRRARLAAVASEIFVIFAGVAFWAIARHQGGDWAGLGLMMAWLIIGVGIVLLLLSLAGLRTLRSLRPENH